MIEVLRLASPSHAPCGVTRPRYVGASVAQTGCRREGQCWRTDLPCPIPASVTCSTPPPNLLTYQCVGEAEQQGDSASAIRIGKLDACRRLQDRHNSCAFSLGAFVDRPVTWH